MLTQRIVLTCMLNVQVQVLLQALVGRATQQERATTSLKESYVYILICLMVMYYGFV